MSNARSFAIWVLAAVGGIFLVNQLGVGLDISLGTPDLNETESTVSQREPATIIRIEPIALDCRARIHSSVPVQGRREHSMFGQVYRTDRVELTAVGDIDTCVRAEAVEILSHSDGRAQVTVPAASIDFVRPRVDAAATMGSVEVDKGFVGRLTDVFPWVDANDGLTPAAYTYAQDVIGSSECVEAAYEATLQAIEMSYRTQFAAKGGDPDLVEVEIVGDPVFDRSEPGGELVGFDFEVAAGGVQCELAPGAQVPAPADDPTEEPRVLTA